MLSLYLCISMHGPHDMHCMQEYIYTSGQIIGFKAKVMNSYSMFGQGLHVETEMGMNLLAFYWLATGWI